MTASYLPRHFNINKIQGSVDLCVRECNPSVKQTFLD